MLHLRGSNLGSVEPSSSLIRRDLNLVQVALHCTSLNSVQLNHDYEAWLYTYTNANWSSTLMSQTGFQTRKVLFAVICLLFVLYLIKVALNNITDVYGCSKSRKYVFYAPEYKFIIQCPLSRLCLLCQWCNTSQEMQVIYPFINLFSKTGS